MHALAVMTAIVSSEISYRIEFEFKIIVQSICCVEFYNIIIDLYLCLKPQNLFGDWKERRKLKNYSILYSNYISSYYTFHYRLGGFDQTSVKLR